MITFARLFLTKSFRLECFRQRKVSNCSAIEAKLDQVQQLAGNTPAALPGREESEDFTLAQQVKAWFAAVEYGKGDYAQRGDGYCEWMIAVPARRGDDQIVVPIQTQIKPSLLVLLHAASHLKNPDLDVLRDRIWTSR